MDRGLGFMDQGSWFMVHGSGFRVTDVGFKVYSSGSLVYGLWFIVWVRGSGSEVWGQQFRVRGRIMESGFRG